MAGDDDGFVARIRGLPWSATKEDITNFFSGCEIKDGAEGIHMTLSREGRPSGEAYVEFESEDDLKKGLDKNNEHMGQRYIEVFTSKKSEIEWMIKRSESRQQDSLIDACVRLRGLPFGCSKEEIFQFFSGLEIVPNGITLPTDYNERSTGEAYVQFASREIAEKAMGKHKEKIGHRYIEIFKSSLREVRAVLGMNSPKIRPSISNRPSPYDRNDRFGGPGGRFGLGRGSRNFRGFLDDVGCDDFEGPTFGNGYSGGSGFGVRDSYGGRGDNLMLGRGDSMMGGSRFGSGSFTNSGRRNFGSTGHCVHMRGLPFRAIEQDIYDFFRPLNPVSVRIGYDTSGRPSGECDVEFETHEEAVKAMSKDKANMQHRYIELFLNSTPSPIGGGAGGRSSSGFGGNTFGSGRSGMMFGNMGSQMGGSGRFGNDFSNSFPSRGSMRNGNNDGPSGGSYYSSLGLGGNMRDGYGSQQMGGMGSRMGNMMGGGNFSAFCN